MKFNNGIILCLLSAGFVSISSLQAETQPTPLNELSHPDERAMYCNFITGQQLIAAAVRSRGKKKTSVVEMMQLMQTAHNISIFGVRVNASKLSPKWLFMLNYRA